MGPSWIIHKARQRDKNSRQELETRTRTTLRSKKQIRTSIMSDQPHDVPHIQEQIRRLKIKRNELLVERVDIKTEIG